MSQDPIGPDDRRPEPSPELDAPTWDGRPRRRSDTGPKRFRAADGFFARVKVVLMWYPPLTWALAGLAGSAGYGASSWVVGKSAPIAQVRTRIEDERAARQHADSLLAALLTMAESAASLRSAAVDEAVDLVRRQTAVLIVDVCLRRTRAELAYMQSVSSFSCPSTRGRP
jgi:hypothetical protein